MKLNLALPMTYTTPAGQQMEKAGYGAYPYECTARDEQPQAMIYRDPVRGCWNSWDHNQPV